MSLEPRSEPAAELLLPGAGVASPGGPGRAVPSPSRSSVSSAQLTGLGMYVGPPPPPPSSARKSVRVRVLPFLFFFLAGGGEEEKDGVSDGRERPRVGAAGASGT